MRANMLRLPLMLLLVVPLVLSLAFISPLVFDPGAFADLFSHPQFWGGLRLSLFTGLSSTALSLVFAVLITASSKGNPAAQSGAMLAVPHLAVAIGLVVLIVPTGVVARLVAWPLQWSVPPQWVAAQDPFGLSLIAALVLKETPFLVFVLASLLNRDDLRQQLAGHVRVARSLGHDMRSIWLRVVLPQVLPRMIWPIVAVFSYGMTVVDMALVIGPTQPPTLAVVIWRDLNDGELAANARGAAGVLLLSTVIIALLVVVGLLLRQGWPRMRGFYSSHPPARPVRKVILTQLWGAWRGIYGLILILLLLQSFAGIWPFPQLLPVSWSSAAWTLLLSDPMPVLHSLWLGLASASLALVASVAWMESARPSQDRVILMACTMVLCLPALMIALGQYRLFLAMGITGTALALFLAHVLPVAAYVFVVLQGPYRGFDGRWQAVSSGLMQPRRIFLTQIKWPLLKAPLLSAWAVGFAVSIAQFVPAQLAAAGRYSTLPMEAVTLSSGGNRALIAVSALALTVLPLLAFVLSGRLGKPRWAP